jgi:SurA-like N-terminal domain/PPIC-type PPIASE domain
MLKIFRSKKFMKRTLIGLSVVIIPAFVLWGAGSVTKKSARIGTIAGKKITTADLAKSRQGIKIDLLLKYYGNFNAFGQILQNRQLLNDLSWQRMLQLHIPEVKNITIRDRDILMFLASHPLFQKNGVFDARTYMYILKNNLNMEPREFEERVRENLKILVIQKKIVSDIAITDEELKNQYNESNSSADITYFLVPSKAYEAGVLVSADEEKKYYETHMEEYTTSPTIDMEYVEFSYTEDDQKDAMTEKIEMIFPLIAKDPDNFSKIAEQHSLKHVKTGSFSREELIPGIKFSDDLYESILDLSIGEISPPLVAPENEKITYIFRKIAEIPSEQLSFEEALPAIKQTLISEKALNRAIERAGVVYDDILKHNLSIEDAAKTNNLPLKTSKKTSKEDYISNIGQAEDIVQKATIAEPGTILPPITVPKGSMIVKVDKINLPDEADFEEEKNTIYMHVMAKKQQAAIKDWLKENAVSSELNQDMGTL